MARLKSVLGDSQEILLASDLIRLGARLQLLEAETSLSRDRLIRLYKEILGVSPPKGMLPFSTDYFLTWQPNIHASLFMAHFRLIRQQSGLSEIEAIIRAYRLYLEQIPPQEGEEPVLSITRAWTLVRFFNSGLLKSAKCSQCAGEFVAAPLARSKYVCGLCRPPSRAGKTRAAKEAQEALEAERLLESDDPAEGELPDGTPPSRAP